MKKKILAVTLGFLAVPMFMVAQNNPSSSNGGFGQGLLDFLIGDNCMVPVYHTNFMFPAEGGKIIKIGNEMFFVKDYLPECQAIPPNATVVSTNGAGKYSGSSGLVNGSNTNTPVGSGNLEQSSGCWSNVR